MGAMGSWGIKADLPTPHTFVLLSSNIRASTLLRESRGERREELSTVVSREKGREPTVVVIGPPA